MQTQSPLFDDLARVMTGAMGMAAAGGIPEPIVRQASFLKRIRRPKTLRRGDAWNYRSRVLGRVARDDAGRTKLVPAFPTPGAYTLQVVVPFFLAARELRPGQRAICRTVFQGRTIEDFELEIVGVLPGGRAEGDMILARATSDRLKHDGIAAGMSGSPVYVDGKLIGALAFSWPFSRDPLCGITPIAENKPNLAIG